MQSRLFYDMNKSNLLKFNNIFSIKNTIKEVLINVDSVMFLFEFNHKPERKLHLINKLEV